MSDPIPRLNAALEGRYRIERELGEGGMATVYLARDEKHNRNVALKVLKPELAAVVGAERFLAEIETTANLQHPHILPLFDSGEADSFLFYVMPYVEGETIRDRLDREHQLPVDDAVQIAKNVAEALDYAHKQGVIHRDIKPANILLQAGKPVISDFGIALAVGVAGGGRLTETGLSLGTPHYMSPEQATGDLSVGAATDIYALGCVLYEMLVGEPPYTGSTAQAILGKIIAGELASAKKHRRSVPPNTDAAIRKALEKVPADRFASAEDFAEALADPAFGHERFTTTSVPADVGYWKRLAGVASALAAGFAVLAGWSLLQADPQPVARFDVTPRLGQDLLEVNVGVGYTLSRDGQRLVYVAEAPGGGSQLWQRRLDALAPSPIPGTEGADSPVLSPDGLSVAFREGPRLRTVPLNGGPPFTVLEGGMGSMYFDWGSDGLLYVSGSGAEVISRVPAAGGQPESVTAPFEDALRVVLPHVLPDGRGLLVTLRRASMEEATIGVVGPDGGQIRELFRGVSARYAASGHIVYATSDYTLMAAPFDLRTLDVTGPPVGLIQGVAVREPGLGAQFTLSESGTLVYRPGGDSSDNLELMRLSREGQATPVEAGWTFETGQDSRDVRVSPDRTKVALTRATDGVEDVWIKELPAGPLSRLTFYEGRDLRPRWAPDGESITFMSNRGGSWSLWSKRADGIGDAELLADLGTSLGGGEGFWSPDGTWLLLGRTTSTQASNTQDIFALRPGVDSVPLPLLATELFGEVTPTLSSDGQWLAYSSNETGAWEVFVRPFPAVDTGKWQVSANGGTMPMWAHSGRELLFVDAGRNVIAAQVETAPTFRPGGLEFLFTLPDDYEASSTRRTYDITSDDEQFFMVRRVGGRSERRLVLVQNFFEELKARVPN